MTGLGCRVRVRDQRNEGGKTAGNLAASSGGLISANMLVAASLASAFTLPSRLPPLASSARCAVVHMADGDGKSDRYNFEDPRQILDNFFNPGGKRVPKVFTRGGRGGKDTGEPSRSSDGDLQEMLQDSCIDWGGLSAREVAAAFMMLKGGSLC